MMVVILWKGYLGLLFGLKKEDWLLMMLVIEVVMMFKGGWIIWVYDVVEIK